MSVREKMLTEALEWALEYIDAIPSDTVLPAMPGFDRDYVDELLAVAKADLQVAKQAEQTPFVLPLDQSGSMSREMEGADLGLRAKLTYPGSFVSDLLIGGQRVQVPNKDLSKAAYIIFTDGEKN